jgi:hypothetical protein
LDAIDAENTLRKIKNTAGKVHEVSTMLEPFTAGVPYLGAANSAISNASLAVENGAREGKGHLAKVRETADKLENMKTLRKGANDWKKEQDAIAAMQAADEGFVE